MNCSTPSNRSPKRLLRRGVVVPMVALLTPILLVLLGFAVDVAHMQNTRTELRLSTDSAARAAATELARTDNINTARNAALRIAEANPVAGVPLKLKAEDVQFGRSNPNSSGRYSFNVGGQPFNSVRVLGQRTTGSTDGAVPLYFGRMVGQPNFEPTATAVSSFVNFDICLVLDRSSSMKLDLDEIATGLTTADPRLCSPPSPTSRWMALDKAVDVFVSVLQASNASEQVALCTYSSNISAEPWLNNCGNSHRTTKAAYVDLGLTYDLSRLQSEINAWTNALFNGNTYIEEGMRTGIRAVTGPGARNSAEKVIIVLTDGRQNVGDARLAAQTCADDGIQCHTITFSDDADETLMAEVAAIAGGKHFHANTEAELREAFRLVAGEIARLTD